MTPAVVSERVPAIPINLPPPLPQNLYQIPKLTFLSPLPKKYDTLKPAMSPTGEQALADQLQDAPPPQSRKSGGDGGGSRGGKGRGGGGGQSRDVQVSKALSKLLRHDAVKAGLELDDEGFAGVGEVVSL